MRVTDLQKVSRLFASPIDQSVDRALVPMIAASGALIEGHFRLQNGQHAQYFLRFGQLTFHSADAARIADVALAALDPPRKDLAVLTVETSAKFATTIAEKTGGRLALTKVGAARRPTADLHKRNALERARAVLIVADVVHTGESIRPLLERAAVTRAPWIQLLAFATLHRGGPARMLAELGVGGTCLLQAQWDVFPPDSCHLCRSGVELLPAFEFI